MYADFVLDIWIQAGIVIVTVVITIMGLRRTLRQNRKNTELRMFATIQAAKLRQMQGNSNPDSDPGSDPQGEEGAENPPGADHGS